MEEVKAVTVHFPWFYVSVLSAFSLFHILIPMMFPLISITIFGIGYNTLFLQTTSFIAMMKTSKTKSNDDRVITLNQLFGKADNMMHK